LLAAEMSRGMSTHRRGITLLRSRGVRLGPAGRQYSQSNDL